MEHPKINICKSTEGNLLHYIYRFKNISSETEIEEYINNQDPIIEILEENADIESTNIKDFLLSRNDFPKGYNGYTEFTLPFEIVIPFKKLIVNLKNDLSSVPQEKIEIQLSSYQTISRILFKKKTDYNGYETYRTITEQYEIDDIIKIRNNNGFLIKKSNAEYNKVTLDFSIDIVTYIDIHAHGVFDPVVSTIEGKNYILFYQKKEEQKNKYEYRVISKFQDGSISELSNVGVCELYENTDEIIQVLEVKEDDIKITKWQEIKREKVSKDININKDDLYSKVIKTITSQEIHSDDSTLITDGIRYVKLPNIWHKNKRKLFYRKSRAFRMKNIYKNISTDYCKPIIFQDKFEILIDKMLIYRKDVTNLSIDEQKKPVDMKDENATIFKIYIRQGGKYYNDYINNIEDNDTIEMVVLNSRYPLLSIKDYCFYSNKYNYTIYLYDEKGNISDPIVAVL
ncbi:hypothetical protein Q3304_10030 [Clostridioides sp. GD02377]|uniref:hypothetical protein n=1 Tax=unclassified Clostridioides TaxID=2635829 RepID=UPI0038A0BDC1